MSRTKQAARKNGVREGNVAPFPKPTRAAKRACKKGNKKALAARSEAFQNFQLEQAQNRRWLQLQRADSNLGGNPTEPNYVELHNYFSCTTPQQRKTSGEISVDCRAILAQLEEERTRSRAVQGGVAQPRDWFIGKEEEASLVSQADQTTNHETGNERSAGVQQLSRTQRKRQKKEQATLHKNVKEAMESTGEVAIEKRQPEPLKGEQLPDLEI